MHQLLSALFAVILSFGHHSAGTRPMEASVSYDAAKPNPVLSFPDRQGRARSVSAGSYSSYAGSACNSCGMTNTSYSVR